MIASLTDLPADSQWSAELVPLEKLALFRETGTWSTPELAPLDLRKESGKVGFVVSFRTAGKATNEFIPLPLAGGIAPTAISHEDFVSVSNAFDIKREEQAGCQVLGPGTIHFIWLIYSTGATWPLTFRGETAQSAMKATIRIGPALPP